MARRMRTPDEISYRKDEEGLSLHEGIFTSRAWEGRKAGIAARVARKVEASRARAQLRRDAAKGATTMLSRAMLRLQERRQATQLARKQRNERYQAKHATA